MPVSLAKVEEFVRSLPGVTEGVRWNRRMYLVGDRSLCWERAFSKADLKRFGDAPVPAGDILAITVEDLDAKEAILAMGLRGFFTIAHFDGYPAVLVALREARAAEVKAVIEQAWRYRRAEAAAPAKRPRRRPAGR